MSVWLIFAIAVIVCAHHFRKYLLPVLRWSKDCGVFGCDHPNHPQRSNL